MTKKLKIKTLDKSLVSLNAIQRRKSPKLSITLSRESHTFMLYLAKKTKNSLSPTIDAFILKYAETEMANLHKS